MRKTLAALVVALALALSAPVRADSRHVEIGYALGEATGEDLLGRSLDNEDTEALHIRIFNDFGKAGLLSGGLNLERLSLPDMPDDPAAYCLDALVRIESPGKWVQFHGAGGFGLVISDKMIVESTQQIEIPLSDATTPSGQHTSVSTETVEVETESDDQTTGLRWNLQTGARLWFTPDHRWGLLLEAGLSKPMGSGFLVDEEVGTGIYLVAPAGN